MKTYNTVGAKFVNETLSPQINEAIRTLDDKLFYTGFVKNLMTADHVDFTMGGKYPGNFSIQGNGEGGPNFRLRGSAMPKFDVKFREDVVDNYINRDVNSIGITTGGVKTTTIVEGGSATHDVTNPDNYHPRGNSNTRGFGTEAGAVTEIITSEIDIRVDQSRIIEEFADQPVIESVKGYAETTVAAFELMAKLVIQTRAYYHWDTIVSSAKRRAEDDGWDGSTVGSGSWLDQFTLVDTSGYSVVGETGYDRAADAVGFWGALTGAQLLLESLINNFHTGIDTSDMYGILTPAVYRTIVDKLQATELAGRIFVSGSKAVGSINGVVMFSDPKIDRNDLQDSKTAASLDAADFGSRVSPNKGKVDFIFGVRGAVLTPMTWNIAKAIAVPRGIQAFILAQEFFYGSGVLDNGLHIVGTPDAAGLVVRENVASALVQSSMSTKMTGTRTVKSDTSTSNSKETEIVTEDKKVDTTKK